MTPRTRLRALVWALLLSMGCGGGCGGGSGCGGSGCLEKIPGGFPANQRQSEAISVKLSQAGLQSITSQVPTLVEQLTNMTGAGYFNIPCVGPLQVTSLGETHITGVVKVNAAVCDNARDLCASHTPSTCNAFIKIDTVKINSHENNSDGSVTIAVTINSELDTGNLPVGLSGTYTAGDFYGANPNPQPTPLGCALNCNIRYNTLASAPPTVALKMDVKLRVDHNYKNILTMDVDVSHLTDALASNQLVVEPNPQSCSPSGQPGLNFTCDIIGTDVIKQLIISQIGAQLGPQIRSLVDGFRCLPCQSDADCPSSPQVSTCGNDVCYVDQSQGICVPNPLGLEGRTNVGNLLGSFGAPPDAALDLYVVAGGTHPVGTPPVEKPSLAATPQDSVQIGVMGGTRAPVAATCVPPAVWTDLPTPPVMDFDTEAHQDGYTDYGIGISVSDPFMDKALFDAWQSGMLCLNVAQENVSLLSSSLFSALLTNLDALTHRENVPMAVAVRPTQPPNIRVGKGTTKLVNGETKIDDPLITLNLPQVHVDFYAFLEERYARLFTIETDLSVPIGLDFVPSSSGTGTSINLLLGDITAPADKTHCLNNLMNVESDEECAGFLPSVIGLVSGQLTGALPSIDLPSFQGIQIDVMGAKGSILMPDHSGYDHLALFAKLSVAPAGPEVAGVRTSATVLSSFVPSQAKPMNEATQPRVTIEAAATGARSLQFAGYEYNYRVDNGPWTFWSSSPRLVVSSPMLRLPGNHDIEVRARAIGEPRSIDPDGVHIPFTVDYSAPTVTLRAESGQLLTNAFDDATPADQIAFRYSINGGEWSAPGPVQAVSLAELGPNAWVRVEASDLAGHSAVASYGAAPAQALKVTRPNTTASTKASATGCSEVGATLWALAGFAGLLSRRRRAVR